METVEHVEVVNWAERGHLYETQDPEDGSVWVNRPDAAWVLMVRTPEGEVYAHKHEFAFTEQGRAQAERVRDKVADAGRFTRERWGFHHNFFGSAAWHEEQAEIVACERAGRDYEY